MASLAATLNTIAPTETINQNITTGRSSTGDSLTEANPVYQTVQEQLSQARAAWASDTAQAQSLQSQIQSNPSQTLTQSEAGLLDLEEKVTADQSSIQSLSSALQQANSNIRIAPVELSQLGGANLPRYPSSPKRYLYLILGLVLGGIAGAGLTYQARRRRASVDLDGISAQQTIGDVEVLTANEHVAEQNYVRVQVGAPVENGADSPEASNGSQG